MKHRVIILYPSAHVCGASICSKTIDETLSTANGDTTFYVSTIAFNVTDVSYIPRLLFLLRFAFMGEEYSQSGHDCLTWSSWCMWINNTKGVYTKVPEFFLDLIAERTGFRPNPEDCLVYAGDFEGYKGMETLLRAEMC